MNNIKGLLESKEVISTGPSTYVPVYSTEKFRYILEMVSSCRNHILKYPVIAFVKDATSLSKLKRRVIKSNSSILSK